jgi:hypothetical protein
VSPHRLNIETEDVARQTENGETDARRAEIGVDKNARCVRQQRAQGGEHRRTAATRKGGCHHSRCVQKKRPCGVAGSNSNPGSVGPPSTSFLPTTHSLLYTPRRIIVACANAAPVSSVAAPRPTPTTAPSKNANPPLTSLKPPQAPKPRHPFPPSSCRITAGSASAAPALFVAALPPTPTTAPSRNANLPLTSPKPP